MSGRYVCTTNAHAPGEESVAELLYNKFQKAITGEGFDMKTMFDTREVFVEDFEDKETVMKALQYVYGDAAHADTGWIDLEDIYLKVMSSREHVARRFFFNQHVEGETTWLTPRLWAECKNIKLLDKKKLKKTDVLAIGFKGNTRRGAALVGCRLIDGALFNMAWWENPGTADWEVPFAQLDAKLRKIMNTYNVVKLIAAPDQYQDIVGRWWADYEDEAEEFWMSNKTKVARAVEQFESAVGQQRLSYLDKDISRHVLNCHTEDVPQGVVLRQETKYTSRYIFGAQAAVLAFAGATLAIEEGLLRPKVDDTLYTF